GAGGVLPDIHHPGVRQMTSALLLFFFFGAGQAAAAPPTAAADSCVTCHAALDDKLGAPAKAFAAGDIHQRNGFSCADCHGGDRTTDDMDKAMSKAHGFVGKPKRTAIPALCAKCHSDANLMQKYKPQQRVDQFQEYKTSRHGKLLASGDEAV